MQSSLRVALGFGTRVAVVINEESDEEEAEPIDVDLPIVHLIAHLRADRDSLRARAASRAAKTTRDDHRAGSGVWFRPPVGIALVFDHAANSATRRSGADDATATVVLFESSVPSHLIVHLTADRARLVGGGGGGGSDKLSSTTTTLKSPAALNFPTGRATRTNSFPPPDRRLRPTGLATRTNYAPTPPDHRPSRRALNFPIGRATRTNRAPTPPARQLSRRAGTDDGGLDVRAGRGARARSLRARCPLPCLSSVLLTATCVAGRRG